MKELYRRWFPLESRSEWQALSFDSVHESRGLRIILKGYKTDVASGRCFSLFFRRPLAYRSINEGDRLMTGGERASFENGEGLYRVEQSRWSDWFIEESAEVHATNEITHYAIITTGPWIDVLSKDAPVAEWLDDEQPA